MQIRPGIVALVALASLVSGCAQAPKASAPAPAPVAAVAPAPAPKSAGPAPLFTAIPYETWKILGGHATFELAQTADGTVLTGRGPLQINGFLTSPRAIGDFRLAVDVKLGSRQSPLGEKMNSGIQIRSQEMAGTVGGLQVEIDPTKRAWSGGIYDERGRDWLAPLKDSTPEAEAARAAFRLGEWNRYEIECIGPRIRTKVNGVPCAVWYDGIVSGLVAFQVHNGAACEVAFRNPMFEELGAHSWRAMPDAAGPSSGERCAWSHPIAAEMRGVRMRVNRTGHVVILAADGTRLADVPFAPAAVAKNADGSTKAAPADAASAWRKLELVWIDGAGSVLLDGARVATLALPQQPTHIRVLGEACETKDSEVLQRD